MTKRLPWLSTLACLHLGAALAQAQNVPAPTQAGDPISLAAPPDAAPIPTLEPVSEGFQPPQPPQPPPPVPQPEASPEAPATSVPTKPVARSSSVWVVRGATPLATRAEFLKTGTCDFSFRTFSVATRSMCNPLIETTDNRRVTANDESPFILNVELLALVGSLRRLGGGISWNPLLTVAKGERQWSSTLGDEISVNGIFEQVFAGTDSTAGLVRGSLGPTVLIPGGDLLNARHATEKACASESRRCDISEGPFLGFNAGLGLGTLHRIGPETRLRFDLMLQYLRLPVRIDEGSVDDGFIQSQGEIRETLTSNRLLIGVGLER